MMFRKYISSLSALAFLSWMLFAQVGVGFLHHHDHESVEVETGITSFTEGDEECFFCSHNLFSDEFVSIEHTILYFSNTTGHTPVSKHFFVYYNPAFPTCGRAPPTVL